MRRFFFILFVYLFISNNNSRAQDVIPVWDFSYSFSDELTALDLGVNVVVGKKRHAFYYGLFGGVAWGTYMDDMSASAVKATLREYLNVGYALDSYELPGETEGGYSFGGKIIYSISITRGFAINFGPRLNYFTAQEIEVEMESSNSEWIYTSYHDIPYKESRFVWGAELFFDFGYYLAPTYAISRLAEGKYMHTIGVKLYPFEGIFVD